MTDNRHPQTKTALITGGSSGLGRALVHALTGRGWAVIADARDRGRLTAELEGTGAELIAGDVTDPAHRRDLIAAVRRHGGLDLLVNNASTLGPVPLRPLADLSAADLQQVFETNTLAPHALAVAALPALTQRGGQLVSISSDAAVEHYETWGGYAAAKAALDHLTLTLAAETGVAGYAVDPGDMRTPMHQDAFFGEDISDRPTPESVVPLLLNLLASRPASGRYRAADFASTEVA